MRKMNLLVFNFLVYFLLKVSAVPEWEWFPLDSDLDSISNGYDVFFDMPSLKIREFFFEKKNVPFEIENLVPEKYVLVYPFEEPFPEDCTFKLEVNNQFHSIEARERKTHLLINMMPAMKDEWKNVTGKIIESTGNFVLLDTPFLLAKFYS